MTSLDAIIEDAAGIPDLVERTLAEFSDADMLVRPCPGANHAVWQLGHLAVGNSFHVKMFDPARTIELPAGYAERFTKETAAIDDPARFPKKADALAVYRSTHEQLVAAMRTVRPEDLARPTGVQWAPTLAAALLAVAGHAMMHVGQFQVIRRRLGKPHMF